MKWFWHRGDSDREFKEAAAKWQLGVLQLAQAAYKAERYMTEKGISHEYPVMINLRKALEPFEEYKKFWDENENSL